MLTPFAFQSSCDELNYVQIVLTKLILICSGHVNLDFQLKQCTGVSACCIDYLRIVFVAVSDIGTSGGNSSVVFQFMTFL